MIVQAQLIFQEADCRELPLGVDITPSRSPANPTPLNSAISSGMAAIESAERQKSANGLNRSRGRGGFDQGW
jgi:hypothetical protein